MRVAYSQSAMRGKEFHGLRLGVQRALAQKELHDSQTRFMFQVAGVAGVCFVAAWVLL